MKYIFPVILCLSYFIGFDKVFWGFNKTSEWWTYFTYSFVHVHFIHAFINSAVLFSFIRFSKFKITDYVFSYAISIAAAFLSVFGNYGEYMVTVGFSGVLYALTGMMAIERIYKSGHNSIPFISMVFISILWSYFSSYLNVEVHLLSFLLGYIYYLIKIFINE